MMIYPGFQGLAGDFSWMYCGTGEYWIFFLQDMRKFILRMDINMEVKRVLWISGYVDSHRAIPLQKFLTSFNLSTLRKHQRKSLMVTSVRVSRAWLACPRCTSGPPWPRSGSGQAPLGAVQSHNHQSPHFLKILLWRWKFQSRFYILLCRNNNCWINNLVFHGTVHDLDI